MTALELARADVRQTAQAVVEAMARGDAKGYYDATIQHLRCVTHRMLAEQAEKRQQKSA